MVTNGNTWTSEDVKLVEKFIDIKNRGYYVSGAELTEAYNRILHKSVGVTNCGSCIRQRVTELESALNQFKKQMELSGMTTTHDLINEIEAIKEENKASEEPRNDVVEEKKKIGRPRKKR